MRDPYFTSHSYHALRIVPARGGLDGLLDDILCVGHPKLSRFIEDFENEVHGWMGEDGAAMDEDEAKSLALAEIIKRAYGVIHAPSLYDLISMGGFDAGDEETILQAAEDIRDAREAANKG